MCILPPLSRSRLFRRSTKMSKKVLVLVGGGHAHIQVILNLPPSITSTHTCILISDVTDAAYSGLLPAVISGLTPEQNAYTPLPPLAAAHKFHFLHARVTDISSATNQITCVSRTTSIPQTLYYDFLSINVGSCTLPLPISSSSAPVILTRPIGDLLPALRRFEMAAPPSPRVVVIGAGAAGIELALAMDARLKHIDPTTSVTLVSRDSLLNDFGRAKAAAVSAELRRRGVKELHALADQVRDGVVTLDNGGHVAFDCLLLATGAAPHDWLARCTDLKTEEGWLHVEQKLNVVGRGNVFAAGDCVTFGARFGEGFPPRAGVYAVRQGPILTHNLKVVLEGRGFMKTFVPQATYLSLLCTGDGRAIGSKYGLVFKGTWVFRLKNYIDEAWQRKFRVEKDDIDKGQEVSNSCFEGTAAEGAALLQAAEDVLMGDSFEKQLTILRRMDLDSNFRDEVLSVAR